MFEVNVLKTQGECKWKKKKKKKKLLVLKKEDWVKKRITSFLKKLNTELAYDPEIPLQIYIQKKWKHMSTQKLDMNVYSSVIHNSLKVQTMRMSMSRWMDKQVVVDPSSGMLFSHEKKDTLTAVFYQCWVSSLKTLVNSVFLSKCFTLLPYSVFR